MSNKRREKCENEFQIVTCSSDIGPELTVALNNERRNIIHNIAARVASTLNNKDSKRQNSARAQGDPWGTPAPLLKVVMET